MSEEQFYNVAHFYIDLHDYLQNYPERPYPVMLATLCKHWKDIIIVEDWMVIEEFKDWVDDNEDKIVVFHD